MAFMEFIEHTFQFPVEAVLHIVNFVLSRVMAVPNNNDTNDLLVLWHCNKLDPLNC
jgi:hypothetical protein